MQNLHTTSATLQRIPADVQRIAFEFLPVRSVLAASRACKALMEAAELDNVWQCAPHLTLPSNFPSHRVLSLSRHITEKSGRLMRRRKLCVQEPG